MNINKLLTKNFISLWIQWHFFEVVNNILDLWRNYLKFNLEYFSIPVLIKTFFYPWHRYRMFYSKRFEPWQYFEAFTFNLMSRIIGVVLRLFFIFLGIFVEVLILFLVPAVFIVWIFLPLIIPVLLLFSLWLLFEKKIYFGIPFLFLSIFIIIFYIQAFLGSKFKNFDKIGFNFIIKRALLNLKGTSFENVRDKDSLLYLAKEDISFQQFLLDKGLKVQDIENLIQWQDYIKEQILKKKRFWEWDNLVKMGTLARTWTSGYTITLDKFSIDLTETIKKAGFPEIIGHKKEIAQMERILSRSEINNVLIVGEPGSGRKSMVYALAEKSFFGKSMPEVNYKRFVQLDLTSLLATTQSQDEVEVILKNIFDEVISAGNVILVIDELHNFIGSSFKPGMVDISGVISNYLHLPQFQIIGITTFEGLHRNIEQNTSLLSLFEKVEVLEVSQEETLLLLERLAVFLEKKYKKIFISYQALKEIIILSSKYLPAIPFPEKAMDLLDEVIIYAVQKKEKIVLPKHVQKIVKDKTKIPVGEITSREKDILLKMEDIIHQRIIDQEEAVKEIAAALRRAKTEITIRKGPIGAFLFLGPTGVGKTETSKALAEIYFGSEERMIRLDMSEFQSVDDMPRLLGKVGQEGMLTTPVRDNPFSLVLLDEFEKAHPNILNLFLQVLDEGHLTDGLGRKVDFKNTIIIATSNAGYQVVLEVLKELTSGTPLYIKSAQGPIGKSSDVWVIVKKRILDYIFSQGIFRPELVNRFDATVVFKPLSKENLLNIAELLLQKLKKNLAEKGIDFVITQSLKEKIVDLGYDPTFGAREMRRVIQDKIENVLARAILSGEISLGSKVEINPENFQFKIKS